MFLGRNTNNFRKNTNMPLTDAKLRTLKPKEKPCRLSDAEGLYIQVTPNGSKPRALAYRFGGKQKTLALGKYPMVRFSRHAAPVMQPSSFCFPILIRRLIARQNVGSCPRFSPNRPDLVGRTIARRRSGPSGAKPEVVALIVTTWNNLRSVGVSVSIFCRCCDII